MRLIGKPETRTERRRVVDDAWRGYVLDGIQPASIGPDIARSWQRAREAYAIDPGMTRPRLVLGPDALAERCERDAVLALATPILREFCSRLALSGHVLAYFDADGWMLRLDGDPRVGDRVAEIDFRPGVSWAEESAGTNGPGTSLAAAKPVEVFASEHFVAAWQEWSCAASPILAPGQSAPVGVVDVTGPWNVQRRQALLVARGIACAIEERLRAATQVRDEIVKYAFRAAHESGDALVAVDCRGGVIAANDATTRRRLLDAGALPRPLLHALRDGLRSSRGEEIHVGADEGAAFVASPVTYEGATVGAIVRFRAPATASRAPRARARPSARYELGRILGRSESLLAAIGLARTAARNDLPVVLYGESGTGKELFAHAIHAAGGRQGGPFVAVNCGSIPAALAEAELFGYEAGTFTGARQQGSGGRFEDADRGTLFLDEVSELSPCAQTALLRVLQEKEVVRLGGSTPRPVDVRIIAATNKPLEEEVRERRFRRDLYYRLNVLPVAVPALRERGDDVALLAQVFLSEAEGQVGRRGLTLGEDAVAALRSYDWPGNVRELRNVIQRAAAVAPGMRIGAEDLHLGEAAEGARRAAPPPPPRAAPEPGPRSPPRATLRETVLQSEREALLSTLEGVSWNFARAAKQLGISRMTLYRRLTRCGISRGDGGP